MQNIKSTT